MPLYVVRWPDLSASLVQAEGEEHLLDILDQVGNADDCEWSIYDGPLFIDFRLPVQWSVEEDPAAIPGNPQRPVIGDIGELAGGNIIEAMQLTLAEGDDGYETGAACFAWIFQSCMPRWRTMPATIHRDIRFLRDVWSAPIVWSDEYQGFFYSESDSFRVQIRSRSLRLEWQQLPGHTGIAIRRQRRLHHTV
jgi:hypothetical protein